MIFYPGVQPFYLLKFFLCLLKYNEVWNVNHRTSHMMIIRDSGDWSWCYAKGIGEVTRPVWSDIRCVCKIVKSDHWLCHMSVHPSVHMEQLSCHWMDFHEILYLSIFKKPVKKIWVLLKYDKNYWYFTWRHCQSCYSSWLEECWLMQGQ